MRELEPAVLALTSDEGYFPGLYCAVASALSALDPARKVDVEGAEIGMLQSASVSDLASCGQVTVEFHDRRPPLTRRDVDDVCRRMRAEGYLIVKPNWPSGDDVLFVNLKSMRTIKRIEFRCRVALANALFIIRRRIFGSGYSS